MTTGRTARLVSMDAYLAKPVLSPDGSRLAFWAAYLAPRQDGRTNATFVTDLRRGADGTLLAGPLRELLALGPEGSNWPWSWTPEARAVWYDTVRWPRLGPNHLFDVVSGSRVAEFRHATRDVEQLIVSPDGGWLAFDDPVSEDRGQLVVTPVVNGMPAGEADWIPLTEADVDVRWPAWSPAGDALFFTSTRDGFVCVWAQRVAKESMRRLGPPVAIYHAHTARLLIGALGPNERGLAVARDNVVFNMSEMTGNIWMTELVDDGRESP
jgi:hypothetical protein